MVRESIWPSLVVFTPLVFAVGVFVTGRKSLKWVKRLSLAGPLLSLVFLVNILPPAVEGVNLVNAITRITPDIWLSFQVDQLGMIFGLTAASLWSLAAVFSWGYMKGEEHQARFYCFLLLNLSWALGVALSGNLLTLYIFYELLSISSYPLIAHEQTPQALAAAKKYLIYVLAGSIFIFLGLILTYFKSGTQVFSENGILDLAMGNRTLILIFTSFMIGFGVKAAVMPLHGWVPDAHPAAPAPASALLSGILVAAGSFSVIRVFYNVFGTALVREIGLHLPMAYLACFTIIVSSILAVTQDDLKRRLAYSTIGQMSYVLLGISLLTRGGFQGGVIHIANHAFMKGTLFMTAGILIKVAGKRRVSRMQGIGLRYPLTMGAFTVAALALIGTPPLAGFISKWMIGTGTLQASRPLFLIVLLLGSLICAGYLLPVVYTAFFKRDAEPLAMIEVPGGRFNEKIRPETQRVPLSMLIPVYLGILAVVVLGIFSALPGLPLYLARAVSITLMPF